VADLAAIDDAAVGNDRVIDRRTHNAISTLPL
jgi:hypothetical protein